MKASLFGYRLRSQLLAGAGAPDGATAVGHLGAVQSQLHDMSLWALSGRTGLTRADLAAEFDAGAFVRTHVLRPTWHHVLAADLPDLLELTADRVRRSLDTGARTADLPAADRLKAADVAVEAVRTDGPLTRTQVQDRLVGEGLAGPGGRWGTVPLAFVLMEAELRGAIGSGPMRGRQHTYQALDLQPSGRTADERLAWLARTYVRGHGPARPEDLAWWATRPITVARRAFALAELRPVTVAGVDLFTDADGAAAPEPAEVPAAMLLANFDELVSYRRDPGDWGPHATDAVLRAQGLLLVDGALAGLWTRTESAGGVVVKVATPVPVTRRVRAALEAEAERYGRFVGLPAELVLA
ncbi:winged helix DNA-binding domain-containing protein [Xylanimonas sp. McL0601]|uniref:winged helix DNA-binding domain-containing protein n=1 Tax=Xylanimonas sp. McL0601 TaxID=3414739 RepID=UPI003CFB4738